ncbi:hypothetical protein MRX96_012189 [Rhipicephalus microplus]
MGISSFRRARAGVAASHASAPGARCPTAGLAAPRPTDGSRRSPLLFGTATAEATPGVDTALPKRRRRGR